MNLNSVTDFKIEVYLPGDYLESIRLALTAAQAGIVGNYDNVFATTQVTGHWRPLPGSDPFQGNIGEMESAPEIKLEVNCKKEHVSATLQAIRVAHPYEEPLMRVIPILNQYFK